jgi:hypothetical protein
MKTLFANSARFGLAVAASLALAGVAAAQPASPVGQWDCVINGPKQTGILFLNFTEDIDPNSGFPTFEGIYIQAGKGGSGSSSDRGGNNVGRTGSPGGGSTNLFGGGFISGVAGEVAGNGGDSDWLVDSRGHRGDWFFNSKGQVVGSYFSVVDASSVVTNFFQTCASTNFPIFLTNGTTFPFSYGVCFTNGVLITNVPWGPADDGESGFTNLTFANTNFTTGLIGATNNVSFVGKVHGNRLTMVGTSAFGKFTITGVPLAPINTVLPVEGYFWTGIKRQSGNQFAEEFTLSDTGIPNVFALAGQGPAYAYGTNSFCMISANKRIGFMVTEVPDITSDPSTGLMRATLGKFVNSRKAIGARTLGETEADLNPISFNAFLTPFIP